MALRVRSLLSSARKSPLPARCNARCMSSAPAHLPLTSLTEEEVAIRDAGASSERASRLRRVMYIRRPALPVSPRTVAAFLRPSQPRGSRKTSSPRACGAWTTRRRWTARSSTGSLRTECVCSAGLAACARATPQQCGSHSTHAARRFAGPTARAHALQFMGIEIPVEHGGSGMGFLAACLAVEEVAKVRFALRRCPLPTVALHSATGGSAGWPPQCPPSPPRPAQVDASVSVCLDVQNTLVNNVFRGWASEDLKARMWPRLAADTVASFCLSEAGSGSDAFALKTRAEAKGDYYVINGARAMWWGRDGEWIKIVTHQPLDTHCACRRVQIVDHEWRRGGHLPCVCDRRFEQGLQGHHVLRGQQGRGGRRTRRWEGVSRLCGFARGDARTGASTHTRTL